MKNAQRIPEGPIPRCINRHEAEHLQGEAIEDGEMFVVTSTNFSRTPGTTVPGHSVGTALGRRGPARHAQYPVMGESRELPVSPLEEVCKDFRGIKGAGRSAGVVAPFTGHGVHAVVTQFAGCRCTDGYTPSAWRRP